MLRLPIGTDEQYLLRLWPSGYRLTDGRPLWIANISLTRARSFYRVLRYPVAETATPDIEHLLSQLPTVHRAARGTTWLLWS